MHRDSGIGAAVTPKHDWPLLYLVELTDFGRAHEPGGVASKRALVFARAWCFGWSQPLYYGPVMYGDCEAASNFMCNFFSIFSAVLDISHELWWRVCCHEAIGIDNWRLASLPVQTMMSWISRWRSVATLGVSFPVPCTADGLLFGFVDIFQVGARETACKQC
jgi:hypothetical protein